MPAEAASGNPVNSYLQQSQKDAITANTNCLDYYALSPIWLSQCNSIKSERIKTMEQEATIKREKDFKDASDSKLVNAHMTEWEHYKDIAAYPPPGTYLCEISSIKAMGGGGISFRTSSTQECESWKSNSHELGRNKPQILETHPDLIPIFLERDKNKAFELCQIEGQRRGYTTADVSLTSEPYRNNVIQAGDGRYHCNIPTPEGTRTFYSFTYVDGSMSANELAANKADNLNDFKAAVEYAKDLPFVAEIDCSGHPLLLCFGAGSQTILGQMEIRSGNSYKMYSGYALLDHQFNLPRFKVPLHERFTLKIRNGSSYNQINLKVYDSLTGTVLFEKSAGPYGSISVRN